MPAKMPVKKTPDVAMTSSTGTFPRAVDDFYATVDAHWLVPALLLSYPLTGAIWEPSAGSGHLARELVARGFRVVATELIERATIKDSPRITFGRDFFKFTAPPEGVQAIVMNPPYDDSAAHCHHAIRMASIYGGKVCALMRNEASSASSRAHLFANSPWFDCKIELLKRPYWVEGPRLAQPRHNFAWFCWDTAKPRGRAPTIKWAP